MAQMADIPGIGTLLAAKLARRGVTTKAQLRGIIDELPKEAQAHLRHDVSRSIPSAAAAAASSELRARLTFGGPTRRRRRYPTFAVGSVRRGAPRSKDLDILVVVPDKSKIRGLLASADLSDNRRGRAAANTLTLVESYATGDRRRSFIARSTPRKGGRPKYYAIDLFLATEKEKPFALFHFTGGRDYNIRVRAHAKRAGYTLNQYGLFCATERTGVKKKRAPGSLAIGTERALMRFLGVTYRSPKKRSKA